MFGFRKEKPVMNNRVEDKDVTKKEDRLQKLRNLKFAIPAAMATFLASCGGEIKSSEDPALDLKTRKEFFISNEGSARIDPQMMQQIFDSYESIKNQLQAQETKAFRLGKDFFAVILNDSTVRVFHDRGESYALDYSEDTTDDHKLSDATRIDSQEESEKNFTHFDWDRVDLARVHWYYPSDCFDLTVGSDQTTLEWGMKDGKKNTTFLADIASDAIEEFSTDADMAEQVSSEDQEEIDALGKIVIDNETGGIIYFIDVEKPETAFHLDADGNMVLGSDKTGPEKAKEFFEMKAGEIEKVREGVKK